MRYQQIVMSFADPIWEFFLEDYEEEDKNKKHRHKKKWENTNKSRSSNSKNNMDDESSYLNIFDPRTKLLDESDNKNDNTWKMDWFDGRDDHDVSNRKQSKRSSISRSKSKDSGTSSRSSKVDRSRSKSRKGENRNNDRDNQEDGFWDLITGSPPTATISKRPPSSNSKGRSLLPSGSDSQASKNASTKVVQSNASVPSTNNVSKFPSKINRQKSSVTSNSTTSKSSMKASRFNTLIASTSSIKSETRSSEKKKKRMLFKKHFKLNKDSKPSQESFSNEHSLQDQEVRHTSLAKEEKEDTEKPSIEDKVKKSVFDPMNLLLQVADSLDPWGLEPPQATNSDTCANEIVGNIDDGISSLTGRDIDEHELDMGDSDSFRSERMHETKGLQSLDSSSHRITDDRTNGKLESLLGQPLLEPNEVNPSRYTYQHSDQVLKQPENKVSTEIRLRVNPLGNTISEEVYKIEKSFHQNNNINESDAPKPMSLEENHSPSITQLDASQTQSQSQSIHVGYSKPIPSFGLSKNPSIASMKDITKITGVEDTAVLSGGDDRSSLSFDKTNTSDSNNGNREGRDVDISNKRNLWKKGMCMFKKAGRNDRTNRLMKTDAAEVFPSSRVIVNGETHSIIGQNTDLVNGMMGIHSDHLEKSKGPQSVYAYDYDSNENMDVSYTKSNQKPRANISVRRLGLPPSLSSSLDVENVVIQVEASTVSETDCIIRQGLWWGDSEPSLQITPGIDVVGKVYNIKQTTGNMYNLRPTQTVMSLVKWGGNSRFMTIHPNQLVKVADGLDPAQVACLPEAYLSAFQVLHKGHKGSLRYRENSLKGKSILILGCMTNNIGKAMIDLALNGGVATIYATARKKHWKKLLSIGVMPLSPNPMEWIQNIAGTIDLVLAPNGNLREDVSPVHFRTLIPKHGQLIICGRRIVGNDIPITEWKRDYQTPTLLCKKSKALQNILRYSSTYDVYQEWESNLEICKRDLSHLLKLLERKIIKPEVLDRLPLNKVAKAQELLELKRLPGFLVCEPWMMSKKRAVYL